MTQDKLRLKVIYTHPMNKPERLPSADLAQWLPANLTDNADDQKAIPLTATTGWHRRFCCPGAFC